MNKLTKGYKTSEFYTVIAMIIVAGLVMTKTIPETDQETVIPIVSDSIEKTVALIGSILTIIKYINSRHELKKHEIEKG